MTTPTTPDTSTSTTGPEPAWSVEIGVYDAYAVAVFAAEADARAYADWHNRVVRISTADAAEVVPIDYYPPGRWHEPTDDPGYDRDDAGDAGVAQ